MKMNFYMPTKVMMEENCVINHANIFSEFGSKAMLVTGRSSAKKNGAQDDVIKTLEMQNMDYVIFDQVMCNPTIKCVYEGAEYAKRHKVDLIIAIGGGSPMDAAKAISLLAAQDISEEKLFDRNYGRQIIPMIHIPTTAGTGSEVTPYAILTNDIKQTKTSIGADILFPKVALCDPKYMKDLGITTSINTAIDALSHAIEGMFSVKASDITNTLAVESIKNIVSCYDALKKGSLSLDERGALLYASTLAGMVISHTGTTAVHSMGYSLTYFHDIDHGRANGLLLAEFMRTIQEDVKETVQVILEAMGLKSVEDFKKWLDVLLGDKERISKEAVQKYAQMASQTKNINNCRAKINEQQIVEIYEKSLRC